MNLAQWGRFVLFKGFTMFQAPKTSLKQDIALTLAIATASFKLSDSKSVGTDDGACWHATLVHGRTKIVTVSNGGYGGPDQSNFHATTEAGKAADKASLEKLFAVPEVLEAVREHLMSDVELARQYSNLSDADYEMRKTAIYTTTPIPNEGCIEFMVGRWADLEQSVNSIKREMKTKLLVVFDGDDAEGKYMFWKMPDTPENRERVKSHAKRKIDYFMGDLFGASNQLSAA